MRYFVSTALGGFGVALGAGLLAAPATGHAEDWIVTVGGGLGISPPYEGADHDVLAPSPSFSVRRADRPYRFTPPDGGDTVALLSTRLLDAGPVVRFRYDRGDSGKLEGFQRIKFAAEPGVFADLWPTDWLRGRIEARRGILGHQGYVGDAGIDVIHTGHKWDLSIGPRLGYGDHKYMDTYFGVTPQEAARSPFIKTPYDPGGGQRYAGLEAAYSYHLSHRWRANVDFGYHRLAHKAADSPVIRFAGSPNQYSASAGFSYNFGVGLGRKSAPKSAP